VKGYDLEKIAADTIERIVYRGEDAKKALARVTVSAVVQKYVLEAAEELALARLMLVAE